MYLEGVGGAARSVKKMVAVNGAIGFFACTNPFSAYKVSLLAFSQGKFKRLKSLGVVDTSKICDHAK